MTERTSLLHPELFELIPVTGATTADKLSDEISRYASMAAVGLPKVSVVIRTMNEQDTLPGLLEDIYSQRYCSEPEVIVLDNESTDSTRDVAKEFGARVVTYPREDFTYARSLNYSMRAASNNIVFATVGHALLSSRQTLLATAVNLQHRDNAGVFGRTLPGPNASAPERAVSIGNFTYIKPAHTSKVLKPAVANLGLFAAQNIGLRKDVWEDLGGFDERWESGGEDTDFAVRAITSGLEIIEDQVVAVHHTHGLSFGDYTKQWIHWAKTLWGPRALDLNALKARRPDLDFS